MIFIIFFSTTLCGHKYIKVTQIPLCNVMLTNELLFFDI